MAQVYRDGPIIFSNRFCVSVITKRERLIIPPSNPLFVYLKSIIAFAQKRLLLALFLLLLIGMTDGIGLLMLVPFLHLVGLGQANAASQYSSDSLTLFAEQLFSALHLPLTLQGVLVLYVVLIVFRSALLRWRQLLLNEIQLGYVDQLRINLYDAIGRANWIFLSKKRTSDLTHVLTSDINRIASGTHSILDILVTGFIVLVHVGVALRLSLAMTITALVSGAMLLLLLWPQVKKAKQLGRELTNANRQVFGTVSDFLEGIKLAKSYGAEQRYKQSFSESIGRLRTQLLTFTRSHSYAQMMYQIGAAVALSLLFYFASVVLSIPGTELVVLTLIFSRLLPLLSRLQGSYQQIVHMLPAFTSAMEITSDCERQAEIMDASSGWEPVLTKELTFNDVQFSYDHDDKPPAIRKLTFNLPANHTLGVAGSSGAGKSTLADICAGLILPTNGDIYLDGHSLQPEDLHSWRKAVAYVPQETFLFHDSVRNNLLWAKPSASETELKSVLELAAADEFVSQLPSKMDTIVGDRGIRLSGGERQRIALARALLAKPQLLILDEATSALDTEHERRIQQAIEQLHGEMTIIIIAHRLSTLRHTDKIIVIEQGSLIESGSWGELMDTPGGRLRTLNEGR